MTEYREYNQQRNPSEPIMEDIKYTTIRASGKKIRNLLEKTPIIYYNKPTYPEIHLRITESTVEIFGLTSADPFISYYTFTEAYFESLDINGSEIFEATIDAQQISKFFKEFKPQETLVLQFEEILQTDPTLRIHLADEIVAEIGLSRLNKKESKVMDTVTDLFDESDTFLNPQKEKPYPVQVKTIADEIKELIRLAEFQDKRHISLSIIDGEFAIDVHPDQNHSISGSLLSIFTEGPDMKTHYTIGIEKLIRDMEGQILVATGPDDDPLCIVQRPKRGCTIRHIISP